MASSASSEGYGYASNPTSRNFGKVGKEHILFLLENAVAYVSPSNHLQSFLTHHLKFITINGLLILHVSNYSVEDR